MTQYLTISPKITLRVLSSKQVQNRTTPLRTTDLSTVCMPLVTWIQMPFYRAFIVQCTVSQVIDGGPPTSSLFCVYNPSPRLRLSLNSSLSRNLPPEVQSAKALLSRSVWNSENRQLGNYRRLLYYNKVITNFSKHFLFEVVSMVHTSQPVSRPYFCRKSLHGRCRIAEELSRNSVKQSATFQRRCDWFCRRCVNGSCDAEHRWWTAY